jgi:hypothetical protein
MNEQIKEKIQRVYDLFESSFIYKNEELILHKKWNIYFLLSDVSMPEDFDYKLLSYLSFHCASNHFKKASDHCKWAWNRLNRWFKKEFAYEELQEIYTKYGCGANRDLGIEFIKNNLKD